jgi:hypothetical protein
MLKIHTDIEDFNDEHRKPTLTTVVIPKTRRATPQMYQKHKVELQKHQI